MLDPEQRAELMALRTTLQLFRENLRQLGKHLETAIVREESLWLAAGERLGREAQDGDPVTAQDEQRAKQIFADCWGKFD
jgi:hypothetical protein